MAKPKAKELPPPIIVKKITVVAGGHHGGAWKVAYADFVTAMMAFFLLMWLLGATTEKQRKGIADYFTPTLVKTRQGSAGSNGLLGGSSLTDVDNYPYRAGQTGTKTMTIPRDATGGPKDGGSKMKRTATLQQRLQQKLQANQQLAKLAKQVRLTMTPEGIRLDLMDDADFSMFRIGTTILTPQATQLIQTIAQAIAPEPNGLTVRGHTDSLQWRPGDPANNWSLSAGRAETTRLALMRFGVSEKRFRRIEGVADQDPLLPASPTDPRNRRMSILLMD
ncbi:flagellar motor protein MotB [Novosphingobium sp. Fuku2-ISO-50]|uniref:flagellar motor protein MotB n=1 Tax=Novosphingobium sp. Fuku2-ISO-50 TaxID=1739114 RepID=UPI00076DED18|nr:flagellar motor protein MotB [Novosphingobium sp. Fuku2-ISO-50]KUR74404.1 flagellar motor protein [Novosphingobium sp. Fuku2-ISO-50]